MEQGTITTVYRYGLRAPLGWDESCEEQISGQGALWNRLVAIETEHHEAVRDISREDQEVAELKRQFEALNCDIEEAIKERAKQRTKVRSKAKAGGADLDTQIADLKRRRREIASQLKISSKRAYGQNRERLRALEKKRQAAVKRARQEAAAGGLWWGHYNAIIASYETARQRAIREGGCLHPRQPGSRARLVNQIIGGMSVAEFQSGAHQQIRLGPQSGGHRANPRFRTLIATVYSRGRRGKDYERHMATWPIFLDRPLPPEARIQQVEISREYRSHCWHWHASFLLRIPAPKERVEGSLVAVNLGWRMLPGGVRVGTVLRVAPPTTGPALGGRVEHIMLAPRALVLAEQCEREQKERDQDADHMVARLRGLDLGDAPIALAESITAILGRNRPSPRDLARVVAEWERQSSWRPDLLAEFQEWRKDNSRLWHHVSNNRRHIVHLRRDHYRAEAKRLLADAWEIVINAHDMTKSARRQESELPAPARRMRFLVAPSELRTAILSLARREGIRVRMVELANDRCATCGMPFAASVAGCATLSWKCPGGHVLDQDENYCRLLLEEGKRRDGENTSAPDRNGRDVAKSGPSGDGRWQRAKEAKRTRLIAEGRSDPDRQAIAALGGNS